MRRLVPALLLAAAAATPLALAAQTVTGELTQPGTRAGIPGARVILLDEGGRAIATGRTRDDGTYELRAPSGGRFTVRAERPGFRGTTSQPVTVGVGETVRVNLASGPATLLPGISATTGTRCEVRPGEGTRVAAVWEEARKALDAARETFNERAYRFRLRSSMRDFVDRARVAAADTVIDREVTLDQPYVAVPLDTIAAHGFVMTRGDTLIYNIPDAGILLSDAFLDTHCFRLAQANSARQGEIGLEFQPVRGRNAPDVKGVLWLGLEPLQLRSMEFEYTDAPLRGPSGTPGGGVDFRALPNGRWIVSRWRLRMPLRVKDPRDLNAMSVQPQMRRQVQTLRELGGEVTAIFTRAGQTVAMEPGATLAGTVWDSVAGRPLRNAQVALQGTHYDAVTDSTGRYVLRYAPEGTFNVVFRAAKLDSLGYTPPPVPVTLVRNQTVARDLAVPSLGRVQALACGAMPAGTGALSGVVRVGGSGAPAPNARVIASWGAGGGRQTRTGAGGVYRFCGVPAGASVSLAAIARDGAASERGVTVTGSAAQRDLTLRPGGNGFASAPGILALRIVRGSEGVPGVRVSVEGTARADTTDADGIAVFAGLAAGRYLVTVEPGEGQRWTQAVNVAAAGLALELAEMAREGTVALAPVVGVARTPTQQAARTSGAVQRVMTRADIERVESGKRNVADLIRGRFAGVNVTEYIDISGRSRVCVGSSRGVSTMSKPVSTCTPVNVVLDGMRLSEDQASETLLRMPPSEIESVEFLNGPQGALRFGTSATDSPGWLIIYTRGMGPHRPQGRAP